VTIVHRFTSPAWYKILGGHLAAALIGKRKESRKQEEDSRYQRVDLFDQIVNLGTGEALVFCPTALLDVVPSDVTEVNNGRNLNADSVQPGNLVNRPSTSRNGPNSMTSEFLPTVLDPERCHVQELGARYIKMKVRKRLTADGGRSILSE
jgi:hypothetical protein